MSELRKKGKFKDTLASLSNGLRMLLESAEGIPLTELEVPDDTSFYSLDDMNKLSQIRADSLMIGQLLTVWRNYVNDCCSSAAGTSSHK